MQLTHLGPYTIDKPLGKGGMGSVYAATDTQTGQRVAIWGSGSKCVSLLSKLGEDAQPDAIVDVNPHKHGKFLAGSGYEISSPESLALVRPDAVIIMNSIYTDEIRTGLEKRGLRPELVAL